MSDHSKKRQWKVEYNKAKTITVWCPVVVYGRTRARQNMGDELRELVCNEQLWATAALRQLRSHNVEQREYLAATAWRKPRKRLLLFNIFYISTIVWLSRLL